MQYLKRLFLSIAFLLGVLATAQAQPVQVMLTWDAYPWPHEVGTLRLEYSINSQTVWYDNGALPGASTSIETSAGAGVCFRLIAVPTTSDTLLGYLESSPSNSACYVVPIVLPAPTGLHISFVTNNGQRGIEAAWDPYPWPGVIGGFAVEQRRTGQTDWIERTDQTDGTMMVAFVPLRPFMGCFLVVAYVGEITSPPSEMVCLCETVCL